MSRLIALTLVAVALGGCSKMQYGGGGGGPGYKTVSAKEEPMTLVALDGTLCTVTPAKYNKVKIGDRVVCGWRSPGDQRPPSMIPD